MAKGKELVELLWTSYAWSRWILRQHWLLLVRNRETLIARNCSNSDGYLRIIFSIVAEDVAVEKVVHIYFKPLKLWTQAEHISVKIWTVETGSKAAVDEYLLYLSLFRLFFASLWIDCSELKIRHSSILLFAFGENYNIYSTQQTYNFLNWKIPL